jgi:hypothetical protein
MSNLFSWLNRQSNLQSIRSAQGFVVLGIYRILIEADHCHAGGTLLDFMLESVRNILTGTDTRRYESKFRIPVSWQLQIL